MPVSELRQQTYLPDGDSLDELIRFVGSGGRRAGQLRRYFLVEEGGERVELPADLYRVVRQTAEALSRGLAVTVAPLATTLTTQQAADVLGISRPTLIRIIEKGELPFERVGTHRKVMLRDVLRLRESRREEQYRALEETALPLEDEEGVAAMLEATNAARKRVAAARRARRV
jgi:excisionase family DNA binding protein